MKLLVVPFYITFSWVLTVGYQLFTDTAVKTIALNIEGFSPTVAGWLNTNQEIVVFIYAFTWIFVLSNVIPDKLFGEDRSVLVKYFVCLICAALTFLAQGFLLDYGGFQAEQLFSAATFLNNPALAVVYLAIPYIVMFGLDFYSRKTRMAKKLLEGKLPEKKEKAPPVQETEKSEGSPVEPS
jgi:amino acid permease